MNDPIENNSKNLGPSLTPRQRARQAAFQFLYRMDGQNLGGLSIESDFKAHAAHFQIPELSYEFAFRLVDTVNRQNLPIDEMIKKHAQNWRIERIGAIERAFLRLGVAELLYFKDVPASVTLDEVIELSKAFGEADTGAFLNGVLDPVSREPESVQGKVESI